MKIKTTVAALGLLSMVSFGAFAAQSITITTSGIDGSPSDIKAQLSDKADAKGATAYHIIEARIDGNYHATAEIYR